MYDFLEPDFLSMLGGGGTSLFTNGWITIAGAGNLQHPATVVFHGGTSYSFVMPFGTVPGLDAVGGPMVLRQRPAVVIAAGTACVGCSAIGDGEILTDMVGLHGDFYLRFGFGGNIWESNDILHLP